MGSLAFSMGLCPAPWPELTVLSTAASAASASASPSALETLASLGDNSTGLQYQVGLCGHNGLVGAALSVFVCACVLLAWEVVQELWDPVSRAQVLAKVVAFGALLGGLAGDCVVTVRTFRCNSLPGFWTPRAVVGVEVVTR